MPVERRARVYGQREIQKRKNPGISRDFTRLPLQAQIASYPTRTRSDFPKGQSSHELHETTSPSAAESGAVWRERSLSDIADDPRLPRLIELWPMLAEGTRDVIAKLARLDDLYDVDELTPAMSGGEKAISSGEGLSP